LVSGSGLSKAIGEEIGRMISRTSDTTVAALRFSNAPDLEQHAEFPVAATEGTGPDGLPPSLVMWYAQADRTASNLSPPDTVREARIAPIQC
jgi:hypothetical protein